MTPPVFRRYIGIHYAGAETADSGLKSLRVYSAIIDAELNDKGYIIPGLGDAGDRAFGTAG